MTTKRFVTPLLCLGLCLAFAMMFAPAAEAQSLVGYNCLQNVSNGEFKTNDATQLADLCKDHEIWYFSQVSGTSNYCIKNQSNGKYLEHHATQLSDKCDSDGEYWTLTPVSLEGETVYCVENVENDQYLTSSASQLSKLLRPAAVLAHLQSRLALHPESGQHRVPRKPCHGDGRQMRQSGHLVGEDPG